MVFLFLERQGNFLIVESANGVASFNVFILSSTMCQIDAVKLTKTQKIFIEYRT